MAKSDKRILTLRNGYWSKKINKKTHYFGKDYEGAVKKYLIEKPYLEHGVSVPDGTGENLADLLNSFLSYCDEQLEKGELSQRTYDDYDEVCDMIIEKVSKYTPIAALAADDFDKVRRRLSKGVDGKVAISPKSHNRKLGYARTVFKYASDDNRFIDRPLPYKKALKGNPKRAIRKHKQSKPLRHMSREVILATLNKATPKYRAMILLGINGGFNNSDLAHLKLSTFKRVSEVLSYPRHKTFFPRVTTLWPETIAAIKDVISSRQKSREPYLFLTQAGKPFFGRKYDPISKTFYRYLVSLGLYSEGRNFGALRTTFSEIGKEVGDDIALKALMGHSDGSMLYEEYAKGVYVPRLKKITDHVRSWLFNTSLPEASV